jgi:hypothetical protein
MMNEPVLPTMAVGILWVIWGTEIPDESLELNES